MVSNGDLPSLIWRDHDPYAGVRGYEGHQDLHGWNSHHPLLHDTIVKHLPSVIVEVGVWKGRSSIFMGNILKQNAIDARIIAVDTWLGSSEHWLQDKWRPLLDIQDGRLTLYTTFLRNVVAAQLTDVIVPLPLDSANARELLSRLDVTAQMIHIDASHDYRSVVVDLDNWWERLEPGGVLIGDDYDPSGGTWPAVKKAVDEFLTRTPHEQFETVFPKFAVRKPGLRAGVGRHAIVVLGMHRSGTSGVAGALAKLGATAPRSMAPGAVDNPRGFWESLPIVALNDELLASLGSSWDDWSTIVPEAFDSAAGSLFTERARHLLATEFADARLIVLKDPRICRLTPFWLRVLEQENLSPVFVIPLRSPLAVALSLRERNGFPVSHGLLLWLRHVLDAESATRKLTRSFVEWDLFPADWRTQTARMAHQLGVELPSTDADAEAKVDAFLETGSKRQPVSWDQVELDPRMQDTIAATFASLRALARDPVDGAALAELDRAKRLFDHSCSLLGPAFSGFGALAEQEKAEIDRRVIQLTATLEQGPTDADQFLAQTDAAFQQERDDIDRRVTELTAALDLQRIDAGRRVMQLTTALDAQRSDADQRVAQLTVALEQERADSARRFAELNEALNRERADSIRRLGELAGTLRQERAVAQASEEVHGSALQRERQRVDDLQAELSLVSRQLETARQRSLAGQSRALARFLRRLARSE